MNNDDDLLKLHSPSKNQQGKFEDSVFSAKNKGSMEDQINKIH